MKRKQNKNDPMFELLQNMSMALMKTCIYLLNTKLLHGSNSYIFHMSYQVTNQETMGNKPLQIF